MRTLIFGYFLRSGFRHPDAPNSDFILMVPVKEYLTNFIILAILNFIFVLTFTVFPARPSPLLNTWTHLEVAETL